MASKHLSRRDFSRLTAAALGGAMAGVSLVGCDDKAGTKPPTTGGTTPPTTGGETPAADHSVSYLLEEPHICRGLNTCKGKGKGGANECAGTSACATAAEHTCSGQNECKGQGGCGEYPGQNACKGKGACGVPATHGDTWQKARQAFEAEFEKKNGKKPGAAPEKAA